MVTLRNLLEVPGWKKLLLQCLMSERHMVWLADHERTFNSMMDAVDTVQWEDGVFAGWAVIQNDRYVGCIWGERFDDEFYADWFFDEGVSGQAKVHTVKLAEREIQDLGCSKISGIIRADNRPSLVLARYVGYRVESTLQKVCQGTPKAYKKVVKGWPSM